MSEQIITTIIAIVFGNIVGYFIGYNRGLRNAPINILRDDKKE